MRLSIFFDVDHTLIDSGNELRPGVRRLLERLNADGHAVYLWSGVGRRWEVVTAHALDGLVDGCFEKPLYHYEAMLGPLGIPVRPDFVVDDHPHLVHAFGGCVVRRYLAADTADGEMDRVYAEVQRTITFRRRQTLR
jgi:phosphoglycolate phosphatase-like HAD superfamily hydrolase